MKIAAHSMAALTAFILTSTFASAQENFVISGTETTTNGGKTLDDDDSITVTETGTVTTGEDSGDGIYAIGNTNTLTNSGTITTLGNFARGLRADGNTNTLINSGTITTSGNPADALLVVGGVNTLTNSGTITTLGNFTRGLRADGNTNTLINSGTITTSGDPADALLVVGDVNTLTNSGRITTLGNFARGLRAVGNTNTLINSGTITTSGNPAGGLSVFGSVNRIINSGTISTTGSYSSGLYADGNDNTLVNIGNITTAEIRSRGLRLEGNTSALNNRGKITTNGDFSPGLLVDGSNNRLNNSGIVITSGIGAAGLSATGDTNTLTNSGTVIAKQSRSIYLSGADGTVNLSEGSVLYGDIGFVTAAPATLNFGAGLNASVNTPNTIPDKISVANGAYAVDGSTIHAVDAHSFAAGDLFPGVMGGMILDTLDAQVTANPVSVTRGAPTTNKEWIQGFGGQRRHDGDSMTMAFTSKTYGMMAGRYLDSSSGVFAGVARNTTASDRTFDTESESIFAGYHTSYNLDDMAVEASLTFGVTQNESSRLIANNMVIGGLETATGDYTSYFLMPSATFKGDWALGNTGFEPSIRLRYAAIHDRGYTETGSAAAMTVDSRTSHLGEVRLQVERAMADHTIETGTLMSNLRLGVDTQYLHGDDISGTLAGQDITFIPDADNHSGRAFIGLNMAHLSDDGLRELRGSVEVGRASVGIADVSASLRWSMHF